MRIEDTFLPEGANGWNRKWAPIERAPKDGGPVWARGWDCGKSDTSRHTGWVYWNGTEWQWAANGNGAYLAVYITEYMV